MQVELIAPKRLIAERIKAKSGPALLQHAEGILANEEVEGRDGCCVCLRHGLCTRGMPSDEAVTGPEQDNKEQGCRGLPRDLHGVTPLVPYVRDTRRLWQQ